MGNPINNDFSNMIMDLVDQKHLITQSERLWLGGSPGPEGGDGSRPGGFIGTLNQTKVSYDTTEAATLVGSGTLLDNLNNIRYNVSILSGVLYSGFLGLNDTPDTYSGQANSLVKVKEDETGLEFTDEITVDNGIVYIKNELEVLGSGIILSSPDTTRWLITIDNAGALVTTSL
jgi:hypothetical protein